MGAKKVHTYKGKKAWYGRTGRLWHVREGAETTSFKSVDDMLKAYPDLIAVPAIEAATLRRAERKTRTKKEVTLQPKKEVAENRIKPSNSPKEKLVTCYYCSGKGRISFGMRCPNCDGKGSYIVTGKGIWD